MSTPISSVGVADSRFSYQGCGVFCLEALLQRLALIALQQAGVFCGKHAAQIATTEPLGQPTARIGLFGVAFLHRIKTRHTQQGIRRILRHGKSPLALRRNKARDSCFQHQGVGIQADHDKWPVSETQQNLFLNERIDCAAVNVLLRFFG